MTKAAVITHSVYGNTQKVGQALGKGLKEKGITVDYYKVEDVDPTKLIKYDLLAFGSPTHAFRPSVPMKKLLEKLKGTDVEGKWGFAFDTKYKSRLAGNASKHIEKKLKKLGLRIIHPRESAIVTGKEGPLVEGTEDRFRKIGAEIGSLLKQQ